mmetsp:Transcript_41114/g.97544  ORF Transcript_41114/g.97544 Transcript_41114/m.97544 type:complete len:259 (+) Transcript_41114:55-831(+)
MADDNNVLTEEEMMWMHELEAAAHKAGLQSPGKFWMASAALVGKGDVKKGLKRIKNWQQLEEKYKLSEIDRDECKAFVLGKLPEALHAMGNSTEGHMSFALWFGGFHPSKVTNEQELRYWMRGCQMTFQICCPTISAVRRGMVLTLWCQDMGVGNLSLSLEQKVSALYQDAMPIKIKQVIVVDPPGIFGILKGIASLFLKKKLMDRVLLTEKDKLTNIFPPSSVSARLGGANTEEFFTWHERQWNQYLQSVEELERTL